MNTLITIFAIIIISILFVILGRSQTILSDLRWLKERFISERQSDYRTVNLAQEFENLSPFYFFPFSDFAIGIKEKKASIGKEVDRLVRYMETLELREMEVFAKTKGAFEKPFSPSSALISAQESWYIERLKQIRVGEWEVLFQNIFLALIAGQIEIVEAKNRLEAVKFVELDMLNIGGKKEAEKFVSNSNIHWSAGEWEKRMELLQKLNSLGS